MGIGILLLGFLIGTIFSGLGSIPTELFDYLAMTEGQAIWEIDDTDNLMGERVTVVHLRSQVWRGITWEHTLLICEPIDLKVSDVVLLFISGDHGPKDALLGLYMAELTGMRVAILPDVPNQPLFGLREDALIAYTFQRYLEEGDSNWPLLFPMTRSAIAAMDAVEAIAKERWETPLRGFMVAGASKRGWTTYLVAAAVPERVLGIVPMVFDMLNIAIQIEHQIDIWGDISPQIRDYADLFLATEMQSPLGRRLTELVDPFTYRYALTMPKLIILGSNDPYWPVDALTFYWADLPQPKLTLMVPNSGHGLDDRMRVTQAVAAFIHLVASGAPLPRLDSSLNESLPELEFTVTADQIPIETRLWLAESPVRNFSEALWREYPLLQNNDKWQARITRPQREFLALFAEFVFVVNGHRLYISTLVRVIHPSFG